MDMDRQGYPDSPVRDGELMTAQRLIEDADRTLAQIFVGGDGVMQMAAARMMLKQAHGLILRFPPPEGEENAGSTGGEHEDKEAP